MNADERKQDYASFLKENTLLPIYIQPWYLDLVCGDENWSACVVKKAGKAVAVLPYCIKRNRYFRWVGMPPLSKLHGPHISKEYDNSRYHHSIVEELLGQLPDVAFYQQALSYDFKNWLPYLWLGYNQVTLYSYVFQSLDLEKIFGDMEPDYKRRIKKASQDLQIRTDISFQSFYDIIAKTYARQKLAPPFSYNFLDSYYRALKTRPAAAIFGLVDGSGILQSVAMLVWDSSTAYYILEGTDPDAKNKNAATYMKWRAIRYAKENLGLDRFDFEGSISRRIEKIYREFGAQATPYYVIKKYNSRLFLGLKFVQNFQQYGKLVQW